MCAQQEVKSVVLQRFPFPYITTAVIHSTSRLCVCVCLLFQEKHKLYCIKLAILFLSRFAVIRFSYQESYGLQDSEDCVLLLFVVCGSLPTGFPNL